MSKRRPLYTAKQTRISVQDVHDFTTPAGVSLENDEMRRIATEVNDQREAIEALKSAGQPEAKGRKIVSPTSPSGDGKGDTIINNNTYITYESPTMISGYVWVNRRPQTPPAGGYPDSDAYKYQNREYDPAHGYYGYYVYATIRHNWNLANKDNYVIELIDQHETFRDVDQSQNMRPQHEGLDRQRVIIHGVYKPGDGRLVYNDKGQLLTNLFFHFVLIRKETADEVQIETGAWIVIGTDNTIWAISINTAGTLFIDEVQDMQFQEIVLRSPSGFNYKITVTITAGVAALSSELVDVAGADEIMIRDSANTLWKIVVGDDGQLITI